MVAVKYTKAHRFELSYWAVARYGQSGPICVAVVGNDLANVCVLAAVVSSIQISMQMDPM